VRQEHLLKQGIIHFPREKIVRKSAKIIRKSVKIIRKSGKIIRKSANGRLGVQAVILSIGWADCQILSVLT
jgi:hypothetical protein